VFPPFIAPLFGLLAHRATRILSRSLTKSGSLFKLKADKKNFQRHPADTFLGEKEFLVGGENFKNNVKIKQKDSFAGYLSNDK
jgi:hypothetical protein